MSVEIDSLSIEIEATSDAAVKSIDNLSESLQRLRQSAKNGAGLRAVSNRLKDIAESAGGVGKVTNHLKDLATEANNVGKSASGINTFTGSFGKFAAKTYLVHKAVDFLSDCVNSINEYVETVNLFQVSMGEFYDEAFEYAKLVNTKLGIDTAQWMKVQGIFMAMAKGFGASKEQAYNLSESLTELSYDIASLYNEDVTTAAGRLQSALAGEIEPIRRLGISISQATLQEYAMAKGIKENVSEMTEQEKALLRSLKLIEGADTIGAIGDFTKTLESPANSIRILKQQFVEMGRAIGSVLLPIIIQTIPYIQAMVSVLTDAISAIATFVGFSMPEWDLSDWGDGMTDDLTDGLDDATASAKKLKKELLGIDELTILQKTDSESINGVSGWASELSIPNLWDQSALNEIRTKANEIEEELKPILALVTGIAAGFALWSIAPTLLAGANTLWNAIKYLGGAIGPITDDVAKLKSTLQTFGIVITITGIALEYAGLVNLFKGDTTLANILKAAIGAALGIAGSLLVFGTGTLGWTVGLGLVITTAIVAWKVAERERYEQSEFYQHMQKLKAKAEEVTEWSKQVKIKIETRYDDYSKIESDFAAYKEILDEIFRLEELPVKTNEQLDLMEHYVGIINSLNIEGLHLSFNKAKGTIAETKDEIYGVIDALYEQAKTEAIYDMLVETYKDLYDAQKNLTEISRERMAAESILTEKTEVYNEVQAKYNEHLAQAKWWSAEWCTELGFLANDLRIAKREVDDAQSAVDDLTAAEKEATSRVTELTDQIKFFKKELLTAKTATKDAAGDMARAFDEVSKSVEDIRRGLNGLSGVDISVSSKKPTAVPAFASGGFPTTGEMFIARESGPELVGRIGNRTAVANNDQIVSGIASANEGVISAVLNAAQQIIQAVNNNNGDVYLDGDKVGERVTAYQNRQNRMYGKTLQRV